MAKTVDLNNSSYGNYELDAYRRVRTETYGEDLGQTSWVTSEEIEADSGAVAAELEFCRAGNWVRLGLVCATCRRRNRMPHCRVDINPHGIHDSEQLAQKLNLTSLARFEQCKVSKTLPFADSSFDAAFSNDVICHIPNRPKVLSEVFRVLKPGGHFLFSDELVIGGMISDQEVATRSSIGS
jgi:SAM-dependent methyltransferase